MNAIKAEWIKLSSVRSTRVSFLLVVLLTVGLAAIVAAASDSAGNAAALSGLAGVTSGVPGPGLVLLLVSATVAATGEWRSGTFRVTFLAIPDRAWALTAKALTVGVLGAVVGFLSAGAGVLVAGALARPSATELGFGGDLRLLWTVPVAVFFGAFFAIGVGSLVRHSAGAITVLVVWMLVLETLAQTLVVGISAKAVSIPQALLPFTSFEKFVSGHGSSMLTQYSPTMSLLVFATWSLVLFGAGALVTLRRDP
ncbi:ABC transporter permease protein [Segniliparus rotundus DSM 44985]|uniref:ABC transporter permease protein n=1 Tax=Segniliparus rotundus (strain ATCC BAA-972 / CDC 1076 / CIP 108378 / DSM 44985 / JCM 13578) TaxID=640132 RepID=D6ZFI5_SEGRD|nr:ABC transporter permease [Segniliparus rotundus]ADG97709.1 ABC transporter permease protein [Segniliparus rotundus DSM 44985]